MRIRALVIKKIPSKEHDQLVTFYSSELGKFTAVAKSSMKSTSLQSMHLDIFNLVDFELINGRAMPIIAAAQSEEVYRGLKNSMPALAVGSFILEVLDRMVYDHQPDRQLWDFINLTLMELNNKPGEINRDTFRSYQKEMLRILGYRNWDDGSSGGRNFPDTVFEEAAFRQFGSLKLIYSVI